MSDALQTATNPSSKPTVHNCKPAKGAYLGAVADFQLHNIEFSHRDILLWIAANCEYGRLILYPEPINRTFLEDIGRSSGIPICLAKKIER